MKKAVVLLGRGSGPEILMLFCELVFVDGKVLVRQSHLLKSHLKPCHFSSAAVGKIQDPCTISGYLATSVIPAT